MGIAARRLSNRRPPGPQGIQGETGATGPKGRHRGHGAKGDKGDTGAKFPRSPTTYPSRQSRRTRIPGTPPRTARPWFQVVVIESPPASWSAPTASTGLRRHTGPAGPMTGAVVIEPLARPSDRTRCRPPSAATPETRPPRNRLQDSHHRTPRRNRSTFSNANHTYPATTRFLAQVGTMSAARVVTLPAANAVPVGAELIVADQSGTVTTTNTITSAAGRQRHDQRRHVGSDRTGIRLAPLRQRRVAAWICDGGCAAPTTWRRRQRVDCAGQPGRRGAISYDANTILAATTDDTPPRSPWARPRSSVGPRRAVSSR